MGSDGEGKNTSPLGVCDLFQDVVKKERIGGSSDKYPQEEMRSPLSFVAKSSVYNSQNEVVGTRLQGRSGVCGGP